MSNLCPRPLAILLRFALSVLVLPLVVHGTAAAQTCQSFSGLTYGTYPDRSGQIQGLGLDLLAPSGAGAPVPLVIWIHGGGWATGSRRPIPAFVSRLCSLGYAVASVDYRLTDVAIWPAQIQDVKGAVRFLRANAATYGLDPDRFAAWGESAGGQLAAMLGTSGGVGVATVGSARVDLEGSIGGNRGVSSRVQTVVDWYGATDFVAMHFYPSSTDHDDPRSDESVFVGGPVQTKPQRAATANPATYASADDPPFLLMHGTEDPLIPFNQSELLRDALLAHGVRATFVPVQNAGHGHEPWTSSPDIWRVVYDFLDRTLRLTGNGAGASPTPSLPPANGEARGLPTVTVAARAKGQLIITRTGGTASRLRVAYRLSGTAVPGIDYAPLSGKVTLRPGSASATVGVMSLRHKGLEPATFVVLTLEPSATYRVGYPAAAGLSFPADPLTGPVVAVVASDPAGAFQLSRTGDTDAPLTVRITLGGTARNGADYRAVPERIAFPAGVSRVTVPIRLLAGPRRTASPAAGPGMTVTLTVAPDPAYLVGPHAASRVTLRTPPGGDPRLLARKQELDAPGRLAVDRPRPRPFRYRALGAGHRG
jgi:acetyl esterase/lipase